MRTGRVPVEQIFKPRVAVSSQISTPIEFVTSGEVHVVGIIENLCESSARTEIQQVCMRFTNPDTGTMSPNPSSRIATQEGSIVMEAVAALHLCKLGTYRGPGSIAMEAVAALHLCKLSTYLGPAFSLLLS